MDSTAYLLHRIHFGFTITFHYLFPQLTIGLAPLIVFFQTLALRRCSASSPAFPWSSSSGPTGRGFPGSPAEWWANRW